MASLSHLHRISSDAAEERVRSQQVLLPADLVTPSEGQGHWKWHKMEEVSAAYNRGRYSGTRIYASARDRQNRLHISELHIYENSLICKSERQTCIYPKLAYKHINLHISVFFCCFFSFFIFNSSTKLHVAIKTLCFIFVG